MIDMTALVGGVFGGTGATLIWELVIRPLRDRRNIAEMLAAEASFNLSILAAATLSRRSDRVLDAHITTHVYDSVVARVGELPPKIVGQVVATYSYLRGVQELPPLYSQYVDQLRATSEEAPHYSLIVAEIEGVIGRFNDRVPQAFERVGKLQSNLLRVAFPWWSVRRWTTDPAKEIDFDVTARQLRQGIERRDNITAVLQEFENRNGIKA